VRLIRDEMGKRERRYSKTKERRQEKAMTGEEALKSRLVEIGRRIDALGLTIGAGGNISARRGEAMFIKRKGAHLGSAGARDYVKVDILSGRCSSRRFEPSSESYFHLACYGKRKDIGAVIHTHPVFINALGISDIPLERLTYESLVSIGTSVARIAYIRPGTRRLASSVEKAVRDHNAIILKNHGLIAVGADPGEAMARTMAAERAALSYVCAKVMGRTSFIPGKEVLHFICSAGE